MTTVPNPDPTAVILARLEIKVDRLLADSGDHEARLRKLEETSSGGKNWQVILANSIMTALNAVLAGTTVIGN